MSGTFLLDTNAAIARINGDTALIAALQDAELFISVVVLGELYYGAEASTKVADNLQQIELLASSVEVLDCDLETARQFGKVRKQLRVKGKQIPVNDAWIAATAIQHGLTLLTRDAHFDAVDGMAVQGW